MRRIVLVLLAGMLWAQSPAPEPVATTMELMETMAIPSSNALFEAGNLADPDEEEWAELRKQALILAEAGNLLMIGSRVVDRDQWMTDARRLVDAGIAAKRAVEAKDLDGLLGEVGEQILNSCQTCHDHYLNR